MIIIQQKMDFATEDRIDIISVLSRQEKPETEGIAKSSAAWIKPIYTGNISVSAFCLKLAASGANIGRNHMFKWLRENGYISKQKSTWNMPHQKYVNEGILAVNETFVLIADEQVPKYSPLITPKGRIYFTERLAKGSGEAKKIKTM